MNNNIMTLFTAQAKMVFKLLFSWKIFLQSTAGSLVITYLFADFAFLPFLGIAILGNTATGIILALKERKFSGSLLLYKFFLKVVLYAVALIMLHLLTNVPIEGEKITWLQWMIKPALFAILIKEAGSALMNIDKISNGFLPEFITSRFEAFTKTGNIKDLQKNGI